MFQKLILKSLSDFNNEFQVKENNNITCSYTELKKEKDFDTLEINS